MSVSDAFAATSPRIADGSRSIPPETSIVVDILGYLSKGTTDTSPSRSPLREKSWDALRQEPPAKDRDDVSCHESGTQLPTCPSNEPSSSMNSTGPLPASNQLRPGSSRERGLEILDGRSDEDSGQFMFVDDLGNTRFLKTEPAPATSVSVPVTADHQSPFQIESPPPGETAQLKRCNFVTSGCLQ
ncbi:hypothetical protein IFR05_016605 [Cadophora sp. M221]|nr:hypothetical protein IFR05_016605 [Cadophora sp. M221]